MGSGGKNIARDRRLVASRLYIQQMLPGPGHGMSSLAVTARLTMLIADSDRMQQFNSTPESVDVTDLIHYCAKRLKSSQCSQLPHLALTIHSVEAMSSQVERVFSC